MRHSSVATGLHMGMWHHAAYYSKTVWQPGHAGLGRGHKCPGLGQLPIFCK